MAESCEQAEGSLLVGQFQVCNVVGSSKDSGNKSEIWERHAKDNFPKKCRILGCTNDAEVGGHMWVTRRTKFCYILPICQRHNKDPNLDDPNYQWTKANSCLVPREKGDLERVEEMVEGHRLTGRFDVCKVKRQTACRKKFWRRFSKRGFPSTCQINGCSKAATVGRRMWVERLSKFVYVVLICEEHDKDKDFYYPNYKETNANTRLVAHKKQDASRQD